MSLSVIFLTPYPLFALSAWVRWPCPTPQPVASGRVAFQSLRGSGVFLQLGKIGILSCLHKLLSGRRWDLISLHRQRFLSITSRSLPSRWVGAVEVPGLPVLRGAWACAASWASCWNWSWTCCWYCCCRLRDGLQGAWTCAWICERAWNYTQRQREKVQKWVCIVEHRWIHSHVIVWFLDKV